MSPPAPPPSLISDLRSLPRAFWVLFCGTFINRFGTFVWPFLTIYLTRQGYTLSDAAWTISSVGAGALFGSLAGGGTVRISVAKDGSKLDLACTPASQPEVTV